MLNELCKKAHENAKSKGWWDEERSFGEQIALMHSELSEALEEYRNKKPMFYFKEVNGFEVSEMNEWDGEKPEGISIELADTIIRIFDTCGRYGIDLDKAIKIKMKYNETRPYKHGGKTI